MRLTNILYVLGLKENLFLVSMASTINGAKIIIKNDLCQEIKDGRVALSAKKHGVFWLMAATISPWKGKIMCSSTIIVDVGTQILEPFFSCAKPASYPQSKNDETRPRASAKLA